MQKYFYPIFFCYLSFVASSQTTIKGIAPNYVGHTIEAYRVMDYFSDKLGLLASTTVNEDSTFQFQFANEQTQKVIIKSKNNKGFLFVQPNSSYDILFPEKDKYDPYRPSGNPVEVAFFNLDSTDINYKILGFQRWVDHFLGNNYYRKNLDATEFSEKLDRFKLNVEKAYSNDTSTYLKTHVRFTIAGLDNIQHAAERNRYEKHDFYIKNTPVQYNNEAYMLYIKSFYQNLMPRLSNATNEAVYEGILKSSPTIVMQALGTEYTLINLRIREMIMINALGEIYNSKDYPQTNILTILDSLSNRSLFAANSIIAKNITDRITELVPGGKAPDFVLIEKGKATKTIDSYAKKHLYIHFFDPESEKNAIELPLLIDQYNKYGEYVQFLTIYKEQKEYSEKAKERIAKLAWDNYAITPTNSLWKKFNIESFPQYSLIDATGYVVASPALAPTPNGQYETFISCAVGKRKTILKNASIETN